MCLFCAILLCQLCACFVRVCSARDFFAPAGTATKPFNANAPGGKI